MAARLIADELSRVQVETLERNCEEFGIPIYSLGSDRQGIVHVIGPELGVTQPGMTIVCGDSHTSTHGAFGSLAFGIGTSEVEHVLATQCLVQKRPKTMRISYSGELGAGVTPKDLILATIGRLGTGGMTGYAVEYAGPAIEALAMPGRMTICNMTIEGGGRAGMIAPDETTFEWVRGRAGRARRLRRRRRALARAADRRRRQLRHRGRGRRRERSRRWSPGARTPGMVVEVTDAVPDPAAMESPADRESAERALAYMGLEAGTPMTEVALERVFIGSCTNSRIEDLREAAAVVDGRKVAGSVRAMVVPGSQQVKATAEAEGLHEVFRVGRLRMARGGLLDVPGHEPRHPRRGRALRLDLEPQLRGSPGQGRAHPPGQPEDGRRGRDRGTFRRHQGLELKMRPIDVIEGKVSVLDRADVDTDQIIPKQFLKRVERTGFGEFLFYDWIRDGEIELEPNPILVTGRNFGCGSSREHAPWALEDFGFEAIVAPSFADIFYSNCTKIGLLPAILDEEHCRRSPRPARPGSTSTTRPSPAPPASSSSRSSPTSSTGCSTASTTSAITLENAGAIDAFEADRRRRPRAGDDGALMSADASARDWDAATYHRVSDPAEEWGTVGPRPARAARRRARARRRLRQRPGHRAADRAPARGPRDRGRRLAVDDRRRSREVLGDPRTRRWSADLTELRARGAGRRRLLQRRLPLGRSTTTALPRACTRR